MAQKEPYRYLICLLVVGDEMARFDRIEFDVLTLSDEDFYLLETNKYLHVKGKNNKTVVIRIG